MNSDTRRPRLTLYQRLRVLLWLRAREGHEDDLAVPWLEEGDLTFREADTAETAVEGSCLVGEALLWSIAVAYALWREWKLRFPDEEFPKPPGNPPREGAFPESELLPIWVPVKRERCEPHPPVERTLIEALGWTPREVVNGGAGEVVAWFYENIRPPEDWRPLVERHARGLVFGAACGGRPPEGTA
jgi:hypothetical protein